MHISGGLFPPRPAGGSAAQGTGRGALGSWTAKCTPAVAFAPGAPLREKRGPWSSRPIRRHLREPPARCLGGAVSFLARVWGAGAPRPSFTPRSAWGRPGSQGPGVRHSVCKQPQRALGHGEGRRTGVVPGERQPAALASPGGLWPPFAWNTEAPRPAGTGRTSRALPTGTGSIEIPVLCLLVNGGPGTLEVGQPGAGPPAGLPSVRGTRS